MKKASFQRKLIVYNVMIFLVIIVIVVGSLFYYLVRNITRQTLSDYESIAAKSAQQLDTLIYNMDKTAVQIAANPTVVAQFNSLPHDADTNYFVDSPLVAGDVVKLLNSYNFKKDGNTRICLYNDYGDFVYSAITVTTNSAVADFFMTRAYQQAKAHFADNNVYSMFRAPMDDILNDSPQPGKQYIAIVREIKDYYSGQSKNGYVEVQQSIDRVDSMFSDLGSDCFAIICDKAGKIIYWDPVLNDETHAQQRGAVSEMMLSSMPYGITRQGDYYSVRYAIEEAPLDVYVLKDTSSMLQPVRQFGIILFIALLAVVAVAVLSECWMARRVSRPLVALTKSVKDVTIDNLKLELSDTAESDELQQLDVAFNKMLVHLQHAIERQMLSQTNELKSHLFALQSQMNPHFMYNVLAIISMEASVDGNKKIVKMCAALSRMLNYSTAMGDGYSTLKAELEHAGYYMELMKERYEDQLTYDIDALPGCESIRVPKLVIQPLCENCFKHAFATVEDDWRVVVKSIQTPTQWMVTVEDNGCGFPQDYIKQFEQMKSDVTMDNVKEKMEQLSIGGLCLPNLFIRLKLIYQDNYVFQIENTGHGSLVKIGGAITRD